jgi:hypothetical protein
MSSNGNFDMSCKEKLFIGVCLQFTREIKCQKRKRKTVKQPD